MIIINIIRILNNNIIIFIIIINITNNLKFKILDCFNNELQLSLDYSKVQPEINDSNEIYTNIIFYYEDNKQISLDAKILTKNYYLKKIPFTNQKVYKSYTLDGNYYYGLIPMNGT